MGVIVKVLTNAAALWVAVWLLDPRLRLTEDLAEGGWWQLLIISVLLGVANAIVRPILTVLSLPLVIVTLGLFLLVVNAAVLALVIALSSALGLGIESDGFGWTLLAALVVSLVSWAIETITGTR